MLQKSLLLDYPCLFTQSYQLDLEMAGPFMSNGSAHSPLYLSLGSCSLLSTAC